MIAGAPAGGSERSSARRLIVGADKNSNRNEQSPGRRWRGGAVSSVAKTESFLIYK